jgi:RecQ-mediated genome instability protein 1
MASLPAVADGLLAAGFPRPSSQWLSSLISGVRGSNSTPQTVLLATAKHRLMLLDLTTPSLFDPSAVSLPPSLSEPTIKERKVAQSVLVQVLAVEDISKSRWEQIELIEAMERGEKTKGREIIRDVPGEEGENGVRVGAPLVGLKGGPHKLLLEDWKGQRVYGMEIVGVPKVDLGMSIGTKILLKGVTVARGMVLLEPATTVVLGGKIDALHEMWIKNRKKILKEAIEGIH